MSCRMVGGMSDMLITPDDLANTLEDATRFNQSLAEWAITVVSNTARLIANRPAWSTEEQNVPPAALSVVSLAARRLYTNPDRFTREASGDYSYGLDSSVTNADVFTPTEVGTLRRFSPSRPSGGLGTVSTYREDTVAPHGGYVPDGSEFGFPWYRV